MTPRKTPPAPPPADLLEAVRQGDPRQVLVALRDRLALSIELAVRDPYEVGLSPVAPLAKQLRDTIAALAAITPTEAGSPVDQIAKRRAARLAAAKVQPRPARQVVGGAGSDRPGGKRGAVPGRPPAARAERSAGRTP